MTHKTLSARLGNAVEQLDTLRREGSTAEPAAWDAVTSRLNEAIESVDRLETAVKPVMGLIEMEPSFTLPGDSREMRLVDLLHQILYWRDSAGRIHWLAGMELDYLLNVQSFISRNSTLLYLNQMRADYLRVLEGTWSGRAKGIPEQTGDPEVWLENTMLMKRIKDLMKAGE